MFQISENSYGNAIANEIERTEVFDLKRILAITAIFALISAVSCSKKNEDSKENSAADYTAESTSAIVSEESKENSADDYTSTLVSDTSETTTEKDMTTAPTSYTTAAEITDTEETENISGTAAVKGEFKEYVLEDFTDITVKFNMQESNIPQSAAEYEVYDLSQLDFNYPKAECEFIEDEEQSQPIIRCTAFDGRNFYYLACYDIHNLGTGIAYAPKMHYFNIFRYDTSTGENDCIFSWKNDSDGYNLESMIYHDDALWLLGKSGTWQDADIEIFRLVSSENMLVKSLTIPDCKGGMLHISDGGNLLVKGTENDDFSGNFCIYRHNGEWEKISDGFNNDTNYVTVMGGEIVKVISEKRNITIESESLRLSTGIRGSKLVYYSDERVMFLTDTNNLRCLYTYDLKKKTRYIMDLTDFGREFTAIPTGDNLIIKNYDFTYIIPEIGAGFTLEDISADAISGKISDADSRGRSIAKTNICNDDVAIAVTMVNYLAPDNRGLEIFKETPIYRLMIINTNS